jgi:LysM repeat protein
MKLRDTVILVVLAHVGLVLVWVCMGGCSNNKAQEPKQEIAAITPEETGTELPPTQVATRELAKPIVVREETLPPLDISLPDTRGAAAPASPRGTTSDTRTVTPAPAISPAPAATEGAPAPEEIKYVVKKGDTLWALSKNFKVSVAAIVDRNDIQNPAMIREGRELIIPAPKPATTPESPASGSLSGSPLEAMGPSALSGGVEALPVAEDAENAVYRVQPGDTVWKLARTYNTNSTRILEANHISDPTRIQVGQELRIPK